MKLKDSMELHAVAPVVQGNTIQMNNIDPGFAPYHPPSLKNPTRIPADNPNEFSNKFLDKLRRKLKETMENRIRVSKNSNPGVGPMVQSTVVAPHSSIFIPATTAGTDAQEIRSLFAGGPGSGCNPGAGKCGRHAGHELVEKAVHPMKAEAMDRAEQFAKDLISKAKKELEANGYDLSKVAPYPSGLSTSRLDYAIAVEKYQFFNKITSWTQASRRPGEPNIVVMNKEKIEKYISDARFNAEHQYKLFVEKLGQKIGAEVVSAKLTGNHVWGYSHLHVTTKSGDKQVWRTQMIINRSKLGTVFNQFPTRKVKND